MNNPNTWKNMVRARRMWARGEGQVGSLVRNRVWGGGRLPSWPRGKAPTCKCRIQTFDPRSGGSHVPWWQARAWQPRSLCSRALGSNFRSPRCPEPALGQGEAAAAGNLLSASRGEPRSPQLERHLSSTRDPAQPRERKKDVKWLNERKKERNTDSGGTSLVLQRLRLT